MPATSRACPQFSHCRIVLLSYCHGALECLILFIKFDFADFKRNIFSSTNENTLRLVLKIVLCVYLATMTEKAPREQNITIQGLLNI